LSAGLGSLDGADAINGIGTTCPAPCDELDGVDPALRVLDFVDVGVRPTEGLREGSLREASRPSLVCQVLAEPAIRVRVLRSCPHSGRSLKSPGPAPTKVTVPGLNGVTAVWTVAGMFINSRIPKITMTVGFDERFTHGDYGIFVEAAPERLREAETMLREHGAVEVRGEA